MLTKEKAFFGRLWVLWIRKMGIWSQLCRSR